MARRFLLWDHDGVLVDTERWYFEATREALARLGVVFDAERYLAIQARGGSCWDLARERGIPEDQVGEQRRLRNARYREHLRTQRLDIDGVAEVLEKLAAKHRMAIVTTSRRSDFEEIHAGGGLVGFFEFVLTIEDVAQPKPAPDPYLTALARFGGRREEALAVEDSLRGLESARRAGIDCVVVRSTFTAGQHFDGAWRILDSVRELPGLLEE